MKCFLLIFSCYGFYYCTMFCTISMSIQCFAIYNHYLPISFSLREDLKKVIFISLGTPPLKMIKIFSILFGYKTILWALFEKDVFLPLEKLKTLAWHLGRTRHSWELLGGLRDPLEGGVLYMKNFYGLELLKNHNWHPLTPPPPWKW